MKLIDELTSTTIELPDALLWEDEFTWRKVAATGTYSLAGTLIIEQGVKLQGRAISLSPPDESMAWVKRSTVLALQQLAAIPARKFKLKLEYPTDKREFTVVFAPDVDPINARPVKGFSESDSAEWFLVDLKFVEVE